MDEKIKRWKLPYTKEQLAAVIEHQVPIIGDNNHFWAWDIDAGAYVDTGKSSVQVIQDGAVSTEKLATGAVTRDKLAPDVQRSNDNLLDNWYLLDAVNQKGKTSYSDTSGGITADRWYSPPHSNPIAVTLTSVGVVLERTATGGGASVLQRLETPERYAGKQMTASMLVKIEGTGPCLLSGAGANQTFTTGDGEPGPDGYAMIACTGTVPDNPENLSFAIRIGQDSGPAVAMKLTVKAVKLELGPQQTLAQKDSAGNWILNDPPPNKALELMKCQRHMVVLSPGGGSAAYGFAMAISAGIALGCFALPVPLRKVPEIQVSECSNLRLRSGSAMAAVTAVSVLNYAGQPHTNLLNLQLTSSYLTAGNVYLLQAVSGMAPTIIVDANLY